MKRKKKKVTFERILALIMALLLTLGNFSSLSVSAHETDSESSASAEFAEVPEAEADRTESDDMQADSSVEDEQAEDKQTEVVEPEEEAADLEDSISEAVPEDGDLNEDEDSEEASDEEADKEDEDSSEKESEETVYEEQEFTGSTDEVSVYAKGVFPKGTRMELKAVPKTVAIDAADKVVSEKVVDAVAVDITFYYTENGEEKEAVHQGTVDVRLTSFRQIEGEEHSAIHIEDDGRAEVVADAGASAAVVEAKSFSIYAIVGTEGDDIATDDTTVVTYNFYSKTKEEVATLSEAEKQAALLSVQKVKNNDTLYGPAVPEKDGNKFSAWTLEDGSVFSSFGLVSGITVSDKGKDINVYPVFENVRFVFFYDAPKDNADKKIIKTKSGKKGDSVDITDVQIGSLPSNQSVVGWLGEDGSPVTSLTLADENVNLYPVIKEGNYIYFESGEGASYVKPQFVAYGNVSEKPAAPTRKGYALKGWTTDSNPTEASPLFTFGSALSSDITLYAVWTPSEYANYTVIFWRQSVNDPKDAADSAKTYDYVAGETVVRTAKVGTNVSPEYNDTRKSINQGYPNGAYRGFHYNANNSKSVTVNADGTTVLNVYYDRDLLTINFYSGGYGSFTGLYGSTLKSNGYTWPSDEKWENDYDGSGLTFLDAFIFDSISKDKLTLNLYASYGGGNVVINHYKQNLNGEWNDGNPDNSTKTSWGSKFYFTDKYTGFTLSKYRKGNDGWKDAVVDGYVRVYIRKLDIRYTRNSYKLEYNYVVGKIATPIAGYTESILYEAPLSNASYDKAEPQRPQEIPANFIFTGWYKDKELTEKFNFSGTMPANDLVVYAGWKAPTVKVTAYTTKDGGAVHKQFEVGYGENVSKDDITDLPNVGDKTFIGWATKDNSGTLTLYNFETKLYEDLELYPYFAGSVKYTVSYDLNGGEGTVVDSKKYMEGAEADVQPFGTAKAPEGKVFIGWQYNQKIYIPRSKVTVTENITFTAVYGNIPAKTSLRYSTNYPADGGILNPLDYAPAELQDLANNSSVKIYDLAKTGFVTPKGYIFDGWSTKPGEPADGDRIFKPGETVIVDNLKGQNVLYAVWKKKAAPNITITAASAEKTYDGTALTDKNCKVEVTGGLDTSLYEVKAEAEGSATHVNDDRTNKVKGYKIIDIVTQEDVTNSFDLSNVTLKDGTLTIKPAPLTLKAKSGSFEYDGKEHSIKEVEIYLNGDKVETSLESGKTVGKLFGDDKIFAYANGSITDIGKVSNPVLHEFRAGDERDYDIKKTPGELEVYANTSRIVIKANDNNKTYDGIKLTDPGWSSPEHPDDFKIDNNIGYFGDFKIEVEIEGEITHVKDNVTGDDKNNIIKSYTIYKRAADTISARSFSTDEDSEEWEKVDKKNFPNIELVNGVLRIDPKEASIETGSSRRTYNGSPLTNASYMPKGFLDFDLEEMTIRTTGSRTEVGSSSNTYEIEWGPVDKEDYKITDVLGTLTVDSVPTTPTPGPGPAPKPTPKPAPAPAATPAPVVGEVLGARRTDSEQVLGARKNTEGTVLGARRGKTGEESNSSRLMIMASLSALLVLLAGGGKKKKG